MLHLIRDPRDRWEAVKARWGDGHGGVGGSTARWRYSARLAVRNVARYAERYAVIRFEDLVLRPEATLQAICGRISEPYVASMLAMTDAPEYRAKLSEDPARADPSAGPAPLDARYVGRHRGRISDRHVAFIEGAAGLEMAHFDYALARPHLHGGDRFAYRLATWPLNEVRLGAWMARERLQQRAPGRLGRRPSRDKIGA